MKIFYKNVLILGLILFLGYSCSNGPHEATAIPKKAKNIILLIGDGMGIAQVSTSIYFNENTSNFTRFKHSGFINTSSSSHKITDSAAGATAFSTGKKSYNGAIGVDAEKVSHPTILEMASEAGLSTGVIATSSITHATPASFYSHVPSRNMHEEIAAQLFRSDVDYFAGGGLSFFRNRKDGANYYDSLLAHDVVMDTTALDQPKELCNDCQYGFLLAADGMPRMLDGRGDFLPNASKMAIDYLAKDEEGFFLMIEGSQIDWGGHANDADYIITEVLDFDKAIGLALDFAEKDGNTLVIVTADHETGGFALSSTATEEGGSDYDKITGTFSTGGHTATLIPVFAYGPGAEDFGGIYQNTAIFDKMMNAKAW